MKRFVFASLLAAAVYVFGAGIASATPTLDANQLSFGGVTYYVNSSAFVPYYGQVFTAQNTGPLTRVDIGVYYGYIGFGPPTGDLVVDVYAANGAGFPTGAPLASTTILQADIPLSGNSLATANFTTPASVTAGSQYDLVVHSTGVNYFMNNGPGSGAFRLTSSDISTATNLGGSMVFAAYVDVAVPVLDANQLAFSGSLYYVNASAFVPYYGQLFTAGHTGALTRVDIGAYYGYFGFGPPTGDLVVDVYAANGSGFPTGPPLASTTILQADIPLSGNSFATANFTTPAFLTVGSQYDVVVHSTGVNYFMYNSPGSGAFRMTSSDISTATVLGGSMVFAAYVLEGAAPPADTTSPSVVVPGPVTAYATSTAGAVVTFAVTASDPDDTAGPPDCNTPSGSTFPVGTTTVTCTSTDTHSNSGSASFSVTVLPVTVVGPPDPNPSQDATVTFSSPLSIRFACSLDGGAFAACSSPRVYHGLAAGTHTLSVRLAAGGDASTWSWTVVGPGAPTTTITSSTVVGNAATLAFTTSQPGSRFQCSLDHAAFKSCSSGLTYHGLGLGAHSFDVLSTNFAGQVGAPDSTTVTIG